MPTISGHPDAMSDVLSLVRIRGEVLCANEYGAPWAFSFARHQAHFHIIERGSGWLRVDSDDATPPIRLGRGDLVFLPHGCPHTLAFDLGLEPTPIMDALAKSPTHGGLVHHLGGAGEVTTVLSGRLSIDGSLAPRVLSVLPTLIYHGGGTDPSWCLLVAAYLRDEMTMSKAGWSIMIARLIDLLLIHALRDWSAESPTNLGWLSGLVDPMIGKALSAIHEEPGRAWTVEALAGVAGLSRSAFAARFTDVVGQTPLRYLAQWRLDLAADHLRAGGSKIGEIAALVGYGSEAALTRAFKAQFGITPGAFRRASGGG